ncbi:lipopolysaccharide biosynthesis protein [Candidatus Arthromitus sp. SFB-turkey]|uniref:lipopolysaccharide biosynthesis protein n=1 Tax=Candidatus Arthromitus sp. SFB-turkey TaxID=1840217 RepID=UPI000AFC82D4|nr:oligosaccharide flippase family protein [Candidatus Arthromitus sp. SFB-turkey]
MKSISLFKDKIFKNNIAKNFLVVFLGDGFSSVLTLLNLSIMIKVLGLNESSIVNLVISYTLVFDTIFNFQSFNSIIRFLPRALIDKDFLKVKGYLQQGFILDIVTALISFFAANLFLEFICNIFKWDRDIVNLIRVYSFSILFNLTGTSIGIIRVFNKFKYSSYINVFVNSLKFIFYLLSFIINVNMWYFILVELWFGLISSILLLIVTNFIIFKNNLRGIFKNKVVWDKEFLKFNFYCNFMTTLDVPISHLTPFLINKFVGIEFISIYKVIEKIGGIVAKIASPLLNIIYPEISTKVSEEKEKEAISLVRKLFFIIILFGSLIIVFLSLTYKLWINILILDGEKYVLNVLFYVLFVIIKFSFVGVYPLFISLGYIKYNVYIVVIANLIYLGVIPFFSSNFNINGVIISQCIQVFIVIFMQILIMKKGFISRAKL